MQKDFQKKKGRGYRAFLNRLAKPLKERLSPNSLGLDFGAGPGPTLSLMLQEAGHEMSIYDPFFSKNPSAMNQVYDFITATEVVEHLHHPGRELDTKINRQQRQEKYGRY